MGGEWEGEPIITVSLVLHATYLEGLEFDHCPSYCAPVEGPDRTET